MEVLQLTAGKRSALYSLQKTASLINATQLRLSTGRRVNSALDDPINFFTAINHRRRAYDLMAIKDGIREAIQTINAANNGIETTLSLVESAQAIANSAQLTENNDQKAELAKQYNEILSQINHVVDDSFYKGINLIESDSETLEVTFDKTNNSKLTVVGESLNASGLGISSVSTGITVDQDSINFSGYRTRGSVDDVVVTVNNPDAINTSAAGFQAAYHASLSNFGGDAIDHPFKINVERTGEINTDYEGFSIHWDNTSGTWSITDSGPWSNATISGSSDFFAIKLDPPPLRNDITGEALNGSLTGDADLTFDLLEDTGVVDGKNEYPSAIVTLIFSNNILAIDLDGDGETDITADFSVSGGGAVRNLAVSFDLVELNSGGSNWDIESSLSELQTAKLKLRTFETELSSSLNIITTRNTFIDNIISVLEEGGANLINADMNEEAANMLMLQTRQALATSTLRLTA